MSQIQDGASPTIWVGSETILQKILGWVLGADIGHGPDQERCDIDLSTDAELGLNLLEGPSGRVDANADSLRVLLRRLTGRDCRCESRFRGREIEEASDRFRRDFRLIVRVGNENERSAGRRQE